MKFKIRPPVVSVAVLVLGLCLLCGCGRQNEIGIVFGKRDQSNGLKRINNGDGNSALTSAFGNACRLLEERPETYLYFKVDPAFKKRTPMTVTVTVECLAAKPGAFDVQYDGGEPDSPYTASSGHVGFNSGCDDWQTETFVLTDARFQNRQNNGADFRLRVNCPEFYVRRVTVARN